MPRSHARRRAATVAAVIGLALSSSILTAPAAQAAPKLTWEEIGYKKELKADGTRGFQLYHHPHNIGAITWAADPLLGSWTGDTLYVNDKESDGYYIVGQVKQVSTGKIIIDINTKGKPAPSKVKKTKNLKEGTKLQIRACVKKGSKNHGCTSWYSAKA
ncbi:hypothetical protein EF908_05725 [Streptomyces sp. WAC04770]|nr:hypothetical protein [Streptomyces sp. WAC04770]RST24349.1 hypothetical protein EF908_05725 [Streptomyces sp. WAC04770]